MTRKTGLQKQQAWVQSFSISCCAPCLIQGQNVCTIQATRRSTVEQMFGRGIIIQKTPSTPRAMRWKHTLPSCREAGGTRLHLNLQHSQHSGVPEVLLDDFTCFLVYLFVVTRCVSQGSEAAATREGSGRRRLRTVAVDTCVSHQPILVIESSSICNSKRKISL